MSKPVEYAYIRAWHYTSGSFPYYVDAQVERARATGAPADALYERRSPGGVPQGWVTLRDLRTEIRDDETKNLDRWLRDHGYEIPAAVPG